MTDDELERDIRTMLALRDPGPAPVSLSTAVLIGLAAEARSGSSARPIRLAGGLASLAGFAAVVALLMVVVASGGPTPSEPGASPAPSVPYVVQPGDAVVDGAEPPRVQMVVIGAVILGLAAFALRRTSTRQRIAASLGALILLYVAVSVGASGTLAFVIGMYGVDPGRIAAGGEDGMYVAVEGDRPFVLSLTVTNTSRLPTRIVGLERPRPFVQDDGRVLVPRFVGLGVRVRDGDGVGFRPLGELTLAAGQEVDLAILGMAGACSLSEVGPEGQGGYSLQTVTIVHEQLTVQHTGIVELPAPVIITTPASCT